MKQLSMLTAALWLSACDPGERRIEENVLTAVKEAAGEATEYKFTRVAWCPEQAAGMRAAFVAAIGNATASDSSGMGGYLVEVMADGTVYPAVKAGPVLHPSTEALRMDKTYCDGKLVVGPYEAMRQLQDMQSGGY